MTKKLSKIIANRATGNVVRPLGFEPRIAYAPGMYPEPC
jgi:hypothetical protein